LKQIQILDLSGNKKIGVEGSRFLIKRLDHIGIKELSLMSCGLGDESVRLISEKLLETKHKVSKGFWG